MGRRRSHFYLPVCGFTLIEIVCVLVLLALMLAFSTTMFTAFVKGYTVARNADEVAQKAQMALQRMTIEFTYIDPASASGAANNISYNVTSPSIGSHTIRQDGNEIVYTVGGYNYTLADGVAAGSLVFSYYNTFGAGAASVLGSATSMVGISFNMVGEDAGIGMSQVYSTRVKINKLQ